VQNFLCIVELAGHLEALCIAGVMGVHELLCSLEKVKN